MALKHCSECGHQVSESARACPQCGARRGVDWVPWLLGLILMPVAFVVVLALLRAGGEPSEGDRAREFAEVVRGSLNDPASFDVIVLGVSSNGSVCLEYVAANALGGRVRDLAIRTKDNRLVVGSLAEAQWAVLCRDLRRVSGPL